MTSLVEPGPHFNAAAWVVVALLVAYLALVEPWWGRLTYRRLVRERAGDPGALVRCYRLWLAVMWSWVLGVVLVLLLAPGVRPAHVGLAWPRGPHLGYSFGFSTYLIAIVLATGFLMRRRARAGQPVPGQAQFAALLPTTRTEKWYALAMAVSAGVCEELFTRGLLIAAGIGLGLSTYVAAAIAIALFGLAHLYQGIAGVLGTGLVGAMLAGLYLATGSLLLPILVHAIIDIRGFLLVPVVKRAPVVDAAPGPLITGDDAGNQRSTPLPR